MAKEEINKSALALGVTQLMLGLTSWILAGIQIVSYAAYSYIGYGFWCGMMFIIAGSVAAAHGSTTPSRDLVRADAGLSWIAAIFAGIVIALGVLSVLSSISGSAGCTDCTDPTYSICSAWTGGSSKCLDTYGLFVTSLTTVLLIIVAIVEVCVAIATACVACCCSPTARNNRVSSDYDVRKRYSANPYPPPAMQPQPRPPSPPSYRPSAFSMKSETEKKAISTQTASVNDVNGGINEISYAERYSNRPADVPAYTWSPNY